MSFSYIHADRRTTGHKLTSIRIKSPEKIPFNVVDSKPVPTKVVNPNASKSSYKPKQRSHRKTELKKKNRGDFSRGDFIREPN